MGSEGLFPSNGLRGLSGPSCKLAAVVLAVAGPHHFHLARSFLKPWTRALRHAYAHHGLVLSMISSYLTHLTYRTCLTVLTLPTLLTVARGTRGACGGRRYETIRSV